MKLNRIVRHSKIIGLDNSGYQGPVVQSVVSLTSSLRVISLTVLADSIHNILVFFAEKMWVSYSHFFSKKFQHINVSLNVNFNESLTNDIVSFEQLGPGKYFSYYFTKTYVMGTHEKRLDNICFCGKIRKIWILLDWKKHLIKSYVNCFKRKKNKNRTNKKTTYKHVFVKHYALTYMLVEINYQTWEG